MLFRAALAPILVLLSTPVARANIGSDYGFGSRTSALAGAGAAWGQEGYAAYSNPAALSLDEVVDEHALDRRLVLSWGLIDMNPDFKSISGVVIENEVTGDTLRSGDVDTGYRAIFGQELGLVYHLFPDAWNLSFGVTAYFPIDQLAVVDTGEAFVPEYFLYRAEDQRPMFDFGLGADTGGGFHFGAGIHVAFALTTNATINLQTKDGSVSSMRFTADIKPKATPYLGFLYAPVSDPGSFSLGAVVRFPLTSDYDLTVNTNASVLAGSAALDLDFNAMSALYYDPMSIQLGTAIRHAQNARLYLQADYELWSSFKQPSVNILDPSKTCTDPASCSGFPLQPSNNPTPGYQNILVPRIGEEITFGSTVVRAGYSYRASILKSVPNDIGNYLDPPAHEISAGLGFRFKRFLSFATPCGLDLHAAYDALTTQHVTKTSGDENGSTANGEAKIGSPGYDAGGSVYGGGATLTVAF